MPGVERVKLRMKIGLHEFEAEGPRDVVMAQLDIWTRLATLSATTDADRAGAAAPALRDLFHVDKTRQLITLRANVAGRRRNADAALMLLHGFQTCLGGDGTASVPAARLNAALAASGHRLKRPGRVLTSYVAAGLVRRGGRHKHETYALTLPGAQHAAALVKRLASGT